MINRIGAKKAKFYAVIDLTSGYHQTPIHEDCRDFTAFITPSGVYRWTRVPMGLKGAPSYFQRQMQDVVLSGLVGHICEIYIDDVIIYGTTEEEFIKNANTVFERFEKFQIYLNPEKVQIGLSQVEYCGYIIDEHGKSFSEAKREKVLDFERPKTKGQLKSFLGLTNYFRRHVPGYSMLAHKLEQQCQGYDAKSKRLVVRWTPDLIERFNELQAAVEKFSEVVLHE
jgi:hypothetical protein